MIEAFLILSCVFYVLEYSLFRIGMRRVHRLPCAVPDIYPAISVVVASRNEEHNIGRCLHALLQQDYPADRMQIIAVNDESEDRTLSVIEKIAAESPARVTVVNTIEEATDVRGKARAIAQGVDNATGEIILLTDADCVPPSVWARSIVEHFTPEVDVCGAFTLIRSRDFFSAAQQLDWIHLQTLGSCALALGFPVGVVGNNLSFRRAAYDAIGGYRGVRFTITEDFGLLRTMARNGARAIYPCSYNTRNFTMPCVSLGEVIRQKQRWARGGEESTLPGYTIFAVAMLMLIAFSIAPFVSVEAWVLVWSMKFACDLLLLIPTMRRLRSTGQLRYFLLFEFYFVVQLMVIPLLLANRTVVWKGRSYRS